MWEVQHVYSLFPTSNQMSNLLSCIYWNFVAWYIYPSKFHGLNIHVDYLLKSYIVKIKPEACSSELSWSMLKRWLDKSEFQLGEVLENEASEIIWLLAHLPSLEQHHIQNVVLLFTDEHVCEEPQKYEADSPPFLLLHFCKTNSFKNLLDDSSVNKQTPETLTSESNRNTKFYLIMCV